MKKRATGLFSGVGVLSIFWGEVCQLMAEIRGGFRRGGGGADASLPQGFDSLPTQRVPLELFKKSTFGQATLIFPKGAFGANMY